MTSESGGQHRPDSANHEEERTRSRHDDGARELFSLSHYRVVEWIGSGGMGEVYLAEDLRLRRKVALKILREELTKDVSRRERFIREARAAAAIDHPNIAVVHEIDEVDGRTFIAMEFVRGASLRDMIRRERLTLMRCLDVAEQIAVALAKVHDHGIVHRDLKPENILVSDDGYVKVIDFGLAKLLETPSPDSDPNRRSGMEPDGEDLQTREGMVLGTASYMSPEQARGEPVDHRSDIFSFGVVLYEMLTGEAPFKRKSVVETLSAILRDVPPPIRVEQVTTPVELQSCIARCLAKDRADRYQESRDVARDLRELKDRLGPKRAAFSWRHLAAASAIVLALLSGTYWWARRNVAPVAPQEPVSVLIADFANRTGDPVFDGALEQALSLGLEGASFITSYDRPRARRRAGELSKDASGGLDENLARLVCRSQGIRIGIAGSIETRGGGYVIAARAFDPVTGETVSDAEERVDSKAEVLRAAADLSERLRRDLGDTSPASATAMNEETFTTASIEAMNHYARAQELMNGGKFDEAKAEFERAIEADPGFGRAYSGLAVLNFNLGEQEASQRRFDEAMARTERMSERERLRTRGSYFVLRGSYEMAAEELSRLVEQYPADVAGHNNLSLAAFYLRDMGRAADHALRGLAIYPTNVVMRNNLALYAMYAGDFDLASEEARRVQEANPSYYKSYLAVGLSQLATGKPDEAAATYEKIGTIGELEASFAAEALADLALYQGRARDAETLLEAALEKDIAKGRDAAAARKLVMLAEASLLRGDATRALASAEKALGSSTGIAITVPVAAVFLETGREVRALALARELGERLQPEPQAYGKLIEGLAALRRRDVSKAVQVLREAETLADAWLIRCALGRAYLAAGAFPEAQAELELALKRRGEATAVFLDDNPTYRYLADLHYYLGVAQEGLGSSAAADSYRTYLTIKEAGEGGALVEDAKKRLGTSN
jgi:tetratricopeptide (TPR) repeat protein/predicted Ser/Thr protein kinase